MNLFFIPNSNTKWLISYKGRSLSATHDMHIYMFKIHVKTDVCSSIRNDTWCTNFQACMMHEFLFVHGWMHAQGRAQRQGERLPHCTEYLNSCSAPSGLSIMSLSLNHNQTWAECSGCREPLWLACWTTATHLSYQPDLNKQTWPG